MALTWFWRQTGDELHVSIAAGTLTLSFAGQANLSFDGEGRLVGAWYEGRTCRRSLDNRVLLKWLEPGEISRRRRRFLATEEVRRVIDRAYADAAQVRTALATGELGSSSGRRLNANEIDQWLGAVARWDYDALEQDAVRFRGIYKPISILPPDQYLSVVLQATEGCSYNECAFCTFYRDRLFRIKDAAEFETHVSQVRDFLGKGLFLRRSIFLADANAVVIPQSRLLPLLEIVNRHFQFGDGRQPSPQVGPRLAGQWSPAGIHAFVSAPDALRKSADDLRAMSALHVRRLYVGVESGHDPLRRFLRKPGAAADVLDAVESIKAGGLNVGLIFMTGVGGEVFRAEHFRDTVDLIERMPLNAGDLVYVSPFVPAPDSPYLDDMQRAGYSSLDETAIHAEETRFRAALMPQLRARGVRMSRYDIREFVY